ncbi:hypothetical protein MWN34_12605 [Ancylobacter sp. 6x-1]|uniref:Uncharacterized protein n=1 Tax=Ancylobacter crimeensis TaxID=2579147 RepID=A0ABT0DCS0_9HYPH|nr:hypothetical protein [Ancylobacter crimeensis]MCK0197753.1 hypothetical protein [Ancylobacter crimeensis]
MKVLAEFDADVGPVRFRRMRLAQDIHAGPSVMMPAACAGMAAAIIDSGIKDAVRREAWRMYREQRP